MKTCKSCGARLDKPTLICPFCDTPQGIERVTYCKQVLAEIEIPLKLFCDYGTLTSEDMRSLKEFLLDEMKEELLENMDVKECINPATLNRTFRGSIYIGRENKQ